MSDRELIEKVAKAIQRQVDGRDLPTPWESLPDAMRREYLAMAEAAVAAVREPEG